jgi:hypothetical protein
VRVACLSSPQRQIYACLMISIGGVAKEVCTFLSAIYSEGCMRGYACHLRRRDIVLGELLELQPGDFWSKGGGAAEHY